MRAICRSVAMVLQAWLFGAGVLLAQEPPKIIGEISVATITGEAGIRSLTDATLAEAIALGESDGAMDKIVKLGSLLEALRQSRTIMDVLRDPELSPRWTRLLNGKYSISIRSPYAGAAVLAASAKRKFQERPTLSTRTLNADKVSVHVSTGGDFTNVGVIENVVIKRDGAVIRPLKAVVTPATVQNRMGATAAAADGVFTFDFSAFEPSKAITLVLIGRADNFEWTMPPSELAALR